MPQSPAANKARKQNVQLGFWDGAAEVRSHSRPKTTRRPAAPALRVRSSDPQPSQVFDTYWRFAAERQSVFFRKLEGESGTLTADPILKAFKFTNAYRAADRVSQYLIREVIYGGPLDTESVFLRTILFKLFNKIETWELIESKLGEVTAQSFSYDQCGRVLDHAMATGSTIYSAAYIMSSGRRSYGAARKHRNHLALLKAMMADGVPAQVERAASMGDVYALLLSYPSIGKFLAYQYAIDINYGPLTDFSEDDFVQPGPGAFDGIEKCFDDLGDYDETSVIRWVVDRQEEEFARRRLDFRDLWGRQLKLIDCQNLFCEISKYARVYHPEVEDPRGRTQIKQRYRPRGQDLKVWFPPKWDINSRIPEALRAAEPTET